MRALPPSHQPEINWQSFPGLLGHLNIRILIQRSKISKYQATWQVVSQGRFDHRILPELLISPCLPKGSLSLKGEIIQVTSQNCLLPSAGAEVNSETPPTAASEPPILPSKQPTFFWKEEEEREEEGKKGKKKGGRKKIYKLLQKELLEKKHPFAFPIYNRLVCWAVKVVFQEGVQDLRAA